MKKTTHKIFHILRKKAHFENESSFRNPFWKWKHNNIYHFALGTSSTSSLGRLQGLSGVLSSRENSNSESSPGPSGRSVSLATPTAAAATPSSNDERVRELMSRLPPAPPIQMGVTTETVTKRSFTGKFIQETHYFKAFEFSRQNFFMYFAIWTENETTKGITVWNIFSILTVWRSVNLESNLWCHQFAQKTNFRIILCTEINVLEELRKPQFSFKIYWPSNS